MRLKCVKCNAEKEISKEDIDKIKAISENGNISKSTDYLEIFNITRGKCLEQKKHTFIFEESFVNNTQDLIKKYDNISSKKDSDKKEIDNINAEVTDLEGKLNTAKEKKNNLDDMIKKGDNDIENVLQEFENITGGRDIDIWR